MSGTPDDPFAPAFVDGLQQLTMPELRRRRAVADEAETGRSFLRRMVQGRLDIVLAERRRREAGEDAGNTADLVERLPSILGDHVHAPGTGRLPSFMAPGDVDPVLQGHLDSIVANHTLANLPGIGDAELTAVVDALSSFEREVSLERHQLHDVLDRLQEEMVRRYRDNEASVDDLLRAAGAAGGANGAEAHFSAPEPDAP